MRRGFRVTWCEMFTFFSPSHIRATGGFPFLRLRSNFSATIRPHHKYLFRPPLSLRVSDSVSFSLFQSSFPPPILRPTTRMKNSFLRVSLPYAFESPLMPRWWNNGALLIEDWSCKDCESCEDWCAMKLLMNQNWRLRTDEPWRLICDSEKMIMLSSWDLMLNRVESGWLKVSCC